MDRSEFIKIIGDAAKKRQTILDLSNQNIAELPPEIAALEDLTYLDLSYNHLVELPKEIGALKSLKVLQLSYNHLSRLPYEIGNLLVLNELYLRRNDLQELPPEIGKLSNLTRLYIGVNKLSKLPSEIGNLEQLAHLGLKENELQLLPPEIGKLTNLISLSIRGNYLSDIPLEMRNLSALISLDLRENPLPFPVDVLNSQDASIIIKHHLKSHGEDVGFDGKNRAGNVDWNNIIAQNKDAKILSLPNQGISALPPKIAELSALEALWLPNNNLTFLPSEIGQLDKIAEINLRYNKISELPAEIGKLSTLTNLDLRTNQLSSLPTTIKNLKKLSELGLSKNNFTEIVPEIIELTNLARLFLSYNRIQSLSPEIVKLQNLTWLYLRGNSLTAIPSEVCELKNLRVLSLRNNSLSSLPVEIRKLSDLTELHLGENEFTDFPKGICDLSKLTMLNLSNNQIKSIPEEIAQLKNLIELDLRGNPLPIPPEILERTSEPTKIINYYLQLQRQDKKPLNEAKIVIVGQGSVGKTSLIKRLIEDAFDPHETKTDGIQIKHWDVSIEDSIIRLNLWDFGGQEIMHATHQFFMTQRCLYLLVLDSRLDEQENRVEYWLKLIQSFGGNSPIIIACNKCDQHTLDLNWTGLQAKYPTIKTFARQISCKNGEGINELRELIAQEVNQLEHIHDELILSWFEIKKELEQMKADYISYSDYQQLCEKEGIADELSQQTLLGFLHDLGIVLHFHEYPELEGTNVLNPEWVTEGIYQIINSYQLFQRKGELRRSDLDTILNPVKYPRRNQQFILDMMKQFELCFEFDGADEKRFLIPDLLSKEEPDTGEWEDVLAFQFHYDILPSSILSRFIVRMHVYISKQTYWRNGVVLISENEDNRALVKSEPEEKRVLIYIDGQSGTRRRFLEIIRAEFRKLHATFPRIVVQEKIPLPESLDVVVDYKHLLKLESRGIKRFFPEGAEDEIDVRHLLDGIESKSKRIPQTEQGGINFSPRIEVKPNIQVATTANAQSQSIGNVEIQQAKLFLQGGLAELKDEIIEIEPSLKKEIEKVEEGVKALESAKTKEDALKSGALHKLKRFLEKANDTGTVLGKTLHGVKGGYSMLQDVAKYYNQIAQWCGMPVVPDVFLKKDKQP